MTTLNDIELRILGVLIEKSLTQAGSYPLTMNAIVLGANQKQNRDPVLELSEGDIARGLGTLQVKELVEQAPPSPGARANRFRHCIVEVFKWDKRDQAIMGELMLRGRQTAGELRTHASRMIAFADLASVLTTLQALADRPERFVEELPREPGRSANRWRHRIGGSDTAGATPASQAQTATGSMTAAVTGEQASRPAAMHHSSASTPAPPSIDATVSIMAELSKLTELVNRLEQRVDALEQRVGVEGA